MRGTERERQCAATLPVLDLLCLTLRVIVAVSLMSDTATIKKSLISPRVALAV